MNYSEYNIVLDIHKTGSQVALPMTRGENKRRIVVSLMENGRPYKITNGCTAMFAATKPDDNPIYNDCEIDFENNLIIYNVTSQTTAAMGEVKCQIEIIGADGGLLFSPTFSLIVADKLYNQEPILASSEEFNALTAYVSNLEKRVADGEFKGEKGDKGDTGDKGTSVTVAQVQESAIDGGPNRVRFSDGNSIIIKNGSKGSAGPAGKDADESALSPAIICSSLGTEISISDSSESAFEAFSVYGKSIQNGTPTPAAPVDIVSIGDDESTSIKIIGKNHLNIVDKTIDGFTIKNNGTKILISGTNSNTYAIRVKLCDVMLYANVQYCLSGGLTSDNRLVVSKAIDTSEITSGGTPGKFTPTENITMGVYLRVKAEQTLNNYAICPQLEIGPEATKYEPYSERNISTSNLIKGIPIDDPSVATYTDANGQMWYADEIDFEKGVYIQRIAEHICTGNENWIVSSFQFNESEIRFDGTVKANNGGALLNNVMCSHFNYNGVNQNGIWANPMESTEIFLRIMVSKTTFSDVNSLVSFISTQYSNGTPVVFYYPLIRPISIPLTSEQIAQYKALKTTYPSTTILNDENAFMKVGYRADTKNFIKRMVNSVSKVTKIQLLASKWVGTSSPYSQVVTIPGVTANSKIDLNPTVAQLGIFHDKDITFVVENNKGVITVYCVGQKPANDYEIQTTITEVSVI